MNIRGWLRAAACLSGLAVLTAAGATSTTSSDYYDHERMMVSAEAGVWTVIPAACQEVLRHPHTTTIIGTPGNDTLPDPGGTATPGGDDDKPNYSQVVIGLGGDDLLVGGNQD